jgi:peptide/nickel transport system substrate-binding protein
VNRNVSHPFTPVGVFLIDQWRRIGIVVEHLQLDVSPQKITIANGEYQVAIDAFCADSDDPKPLLLPYLSKERSPRNMTRNKNPELDAVYDRFNGATDPAQRAALALEMQRMIISAANSVPVIWYSRIVAHVPQMKGWKITPTHFANQDLASVWLDQ